MRRKLMFWCLVVLVAATLTDPILSVQDMLGYDGLTSSSYWTPGIGGSSSLVDGDWFILRSYSMRFHSGTRYAVRSWMLVAAIVGLGALLTGRPRRNEYFFSPASAIFAAYVFRWAEVLTDMLMAEGICLGEPVSCPNTAMGFWEGDRFTVVAYLLLGAAIVIGGALARKAWHRYMAPSPGPAAVVAITPAVNAATAEDTLPAPDARFSLV